MPFHYFEYLPFEKGYRTLPRYYCSPTAIQKKTTSDIRKLALITEVVFIRKDSPSKVR